MDLVLVSSRQSAKSVLWAISLAMFCLVMGPCVELLEGFLLLADSAFI